MYLYGKHQKDVKQLNNVINTYQKKLDEKVDEVINHVYICLIR